MEIGQRVKIKDIKELPKKMQTESFKGVAGLEAEIVDRLYSEAEAGYVYRLRLIEDEQVEYFHEIDYLNNLVVARFFEVKNGKHRELSRGHGHIIHAGALGVAQAASYAMRRAYEAFMTSEGITLGSKREG